MFFYSKQTVDVSTVHRWVRKSRNSAAIWTWMTSQSARPITVTHDMNGQKSTHLFEKTDEFLSHSRKVFHQFGYSQWDYCSFGLQNLFDWQVLLQLTPQMKTAWLKARVMIFCTVLSKMTRVGCIATTQKWKASCLNYHHPISPRKKKFKTQPSAGKCMLTIFWNYSDITGHKYLVKRIKLNPKLRRIPYGRWNNE